VCYILQTTVSEGQAAFISFLQNVLTLTRLHSIRPQKTVIFVVAAVRTSDFKNDVT